TAYLLAAITAQRRGFGNELRAWLAATPHPAAVAADGATILLSELEALPAEPLVFFLDDFHAISASESILQFLDRVLRYLPPHMHLVISTRTAPGVPPPRLLAEQQIRGRGADDLLFPADEAAGWLAQQTGTPDPAAATQLVATTEGWVT